MNTLTSEPRLSLNQESFLNGVLESAKKGMIIDLN
jgi:hypothetical protein